jgi:beta-lactamase regulating signal transducer with metallopeptidase domain
LVPGFQPLPGSLQVDWLNAPVFAKQPEDPAKHLEFLPNGQLKRSWRLDFKREPHRDGLRMHWIGPSRQHPPSRHDGELSVQLQRLPEGFDLGRRSQVFPLPDSSPMAFHVAVASTDQGVSWASLALGLWAAGAGLLLLRLAGMKIALKRRLLQRAELPDSRMAAMLNRLCRQAGLARPVRLTFSNRISGPFVLGRREVCVPLRAEKSLTAEQQESLLAHELAHIVRRDSRWLLGSALLQSLFFFQPLNWLARRRLQEEAEYLCDDWAVGQTGQGIDLARCLAEVACWIERRPDPLLAPAMAGRRSIFVNRVQRLCRKGPLPLQVRRWKRLAAAVVLLASVSLLAPVISVASPTLNWTSPQGKFLILRLQSDDNPLPAEPPAPRKIYRL